MMGRLDVITASPPGCSWSSRTSRSHLLAQPEFARLQNFRPGVDRVPLEDRCWKSDSILSQISEHVLGDISHALARDQREREGRANELLAGYTALEVQDTPACDLQF